MGDAPRRDGRKVDLVDIPAERLGELPRLRARLFPDALNRGNGLFRQGLGERQHSARDLRLAENGDDPSGNPVPLRKTAGGGALEHPHRLSAAHEVARQEALADHDVADFVEAHYGGPQRPDVGPRPGALLPAPSLEILVRDVPLARARRHKILKSASPQHSHPMIADDIREFLELDARAASTVRAVLHDDASGPIIPRSGILLRSCNAAVLFRLPTCASVV